MGPGQLSGFSFLLLYTQSIIHRIQSKEPADSALPPLPFFGPIFIQSVHQELLLKTWSVHLDTACTPTSTIYFTLDLYQLSGGSKVLYWWQNHSKAPFTQQKTMWMSVQNPCESCTEICMNSEQKYLPLYLTGICGGAYMVQILQSVARQTRRGLAPLNGANPQPDLSHKSVAEIRRGQALEFPYGELHHVNSP